jgi:bacillithiol biosynthesis deacetylase BshB1
MGTNDLDILIFGAHPDDAEIGMGATIYKHSKAGYKVGICDLTSAEMSSNGTVEIRKSEAAEAGRLLGLAQRSNLGLPDRGLRFEPEQIEAIVRELRRLRPKIVFAPYWQDRHPDHVMCGRLVDEAVFNAKLRNYLPELEPVTIEQSYYYFINDLHDAQIIVDVSADYEVKHMALKAYGTQFMTGSGTIATPINGEFLAHLEMRDRVSGHKLGCRYAESFATKRPVAVSLF